MKKKKNEESNLQQYGSLHATAPPAAITPLILAL